MQKNRNNVDFAAKIRKNVQAYCKIVRELDEK